MDMEILRNVCVLWGLMMICLRSEVASQITVTNITTSVHNNPKVPQPLTPFTSSTVTPVSIFGNSTTISNALPQRPPSDESNDTNQLISADITVPFCPDYSCPLSDDFTGCYCEDNCFQFGDCCYDYLIDYLIKYPGFIQDTFVDDTIDKFREFTKHKWNCISNEHGYNAFWMVSTCPEGSQNGTCDNNQHYGVHNVPVDKFVGGKSVITFSNIACATCHGFKSNELVPWDANFVSCNVTEPITESSTLQMISESCHIDFVSKWAKFIRHCDPRIETYSSCHLSEHDNSSVEELMCRSYVLPVSYNITELSVNTIFKNPHCVLCEMTTRTNEEPDCKEMVRKKKEDNIIQPSLDLRLIFDLSLNSDIVITTISCDSKTCNIKEVFDCIKKQCRPIICLKGIVAEDGTCLNVDDDETEIYYKPFNFGLRTGTLQIRLCSDNVTIHPILEVQDMVKNVIVSYGDVINLSPVKTNYINCNSYSAELVEKPKLSELIAKLLTLIRNSDKKLNNYQIALSTYDLSEDLMCRNVMDKDLLTRTSFQRGFDEFLDIDTENRNVSINKSHWKLLVANDTYMFENLVTCKAARNYTELECPALEFDEDDIIIMNGTAKLINTSLEIKPHEFQIINDKIYICIRKLVNVASFLTLYDYPVHFTVVSIVSSSLTVLSVIIIIIMHCVFPQLRNVYGLCITSLSLNILLMHVLLIFQTYIIINQEWCKAFAATVHFAFLSMFMWMTIIGYDMATMLRDVVIVSGPNSKNSTYVFLRYSIVGISVPLIIVGTGLLLDIFHSPFGPGYGEGKRCWLSNKGSVIAFVTVPVSVSLSANCFLFVLSIVTIQKRKISKSMRHTSGHTQYMTVYVKLVIILGLTWAVGLLSGVIKSDGLWLFHMILNGLQGVSLLLCLVTNARITKLFKKEITTVSMSLQTNGKFSSGVASDN